MSDTDKSPKHLEEDYSELFFKEGSTEEGEAIEDESDVKWRRTIAQVR